VLLRLTTGVRLSEIKRAAEEQCLWLLFEGDQRWRCDDVRWQIVANASCRDFEGIVADRCDTWSHTMQAAQDEHSCGTGSQ